MSRIYMKGADMFNSKNGGNLPRKIYRCENVLGESEREAGRSRCQVDTCLAGNSWQGWM